MMSACSGATEEPTPIPDTASVAEGSESSDPSGDEAGSASIGECSNPYYPVILDAHWAYAASGSEIEPYTFTSTVSEVFPDRFTLTLEFDDLTLTQHWECKSEGLVALELGGGTAATLVTGDVETKLETSNIEGVTIPASISPGDEWAHSMDVSGAVDLGSGMSGTAEGQAASKYKAISIENIAVPAGDFEALRVDSEFALDLTITTDGFSLPIAFTSTSSSWYVPNTGWVMSTSNATIFEVPSTEIIELQSYSIP
jgi:hypothetical protein